MKANEIQKLIDFIAKSELNEVNIETADFKISVKKRPEVHTQVVETPVVATQAAAIPNIAQNVAAATSEKVAPVKEESSSTSDESKYITVKSPMIGTFYRSANPDSDPFVKVGDKVGVGQTVCIIEAMKLFNEIESEVSGTIVKVLAENASPVEYDQPLFLVDPS